MLIAISDTNILFVKQLSLHIVRCENAVICRIRPNKINYLIFGLFLSKSDEGGRYFF